MEFYDRKVCGFDNFRIGFPEYKKSIFKNKIEIITDGHGKICGVTNKDSVEFLYIPSEEEGVQISEIKEEAFSGLKMLRRVELSDNLKIVGKRAFYNNKSLDEVVFPESVETLNEGVFEKSSLKKFCFPSSVKYVPSKCFLDCSSLGFIKLPNNLRSIDLLSFSGCKKLKKVDLPPLLSKIGDGAFLDSGIMTLTLPKNIRRVGEMVFSRCIFLKSIYYDGNYDEYKRIEFSKDWNKGLDENCNIYIKEENRWVNIKECKEKDRVLDKKESDALSLLDLTSMPKSEEELLSSFRKIALRFHPDVITKLNLDKEFMAYAEDRFIKAKEAYEYLLKKMKEY